MKNTCAVRVRFEKRFRARVARFYPKDDESIAEVGCWPEKLRRKFGTAGIYSIRRVEKPTPKSVSVVIVGMHRPDMPASFQPYYGICQRFMRELGIIKPALDRQKLIHLIVTKRNQ